MFSFFTLNPGGDKKCQGGDFNRSHVTHDKLVQQSKSSMGQKLKMKVKICLRYNVPVQQMS